MCSIASVLLLMFTLPHKLNVLNPYATLNLKLFIPSCYRDFLALASPPPSPSPRHHPRSCPLRRPRRHRVTTLQHSKYSSPRSPLPRLALPSCPCLALAVTASPALILSLTLAPCPRRLRGTTLTTLQHSSTRSPSSHRSRSPSLRHRRSLAVTTYHTCLQQVHYTQ